MTKIISSTKLLLCLCSIIWLTPASAFELNLSPFGHPTYLGAGLGAGSIDVGSSSFTSLGQDVEVDFDDSSNIASLFFVVPVDRRSGIELSLSYIGNYTFSGTVSGDLNVGVFDGEQTYWGLGINGYYQQLFRGFATRLHLGLVQTLIQTEGDLDLVGKPLQSINDDENSTNLYVSLETNKTIYKDWSLGPAISIIDSGDRVQSFSLKLSKELKN